MKRTGKPGAGDPHAGFDVAGAGDVARGAGLRPGAKAMDEPPDPTVRAPVLDPTTDPRGSKGLYVPNTQDILTIDSGITIHGDTGVIGSNGSVANNGTIASDADGII